MRHSEFANRFEKSGSAMPTTDAVKLGYCASITALARRQSAPNSYTRLLGLRISLETFGVYSGWVASAERGDGSGGLGASSTQQAGRTARAERHQPDFRRHRGPSLGGRNCRIALIGWGLASEARTSYLQSRIFSHFAREASFSVEPGPSETIIFPKWGPYDERLGYTGLPSFIASLSAHGFAVQRQAEWSPRSHALPTRAATPTTPRNRAPG